eukprot:13243075-Ditylum_brightwellii.AAC.1
MPQKKKGWNPARETRTWMRSGMHLAAPARMKSSLTGGGGGGNNTKPRRNSNVSTSFPISSFEQLLQVPTLPSVANAPATVISPGAMSQPPSMHNPYLQQAAQEPN